MGYSSALQLPCMSRKSSGCLLDQLCGLVRPRLESWCPLLRCYSAMRPRLESWCPLLCCYSAMRCDDVVRHYGAVAPGPGTKQLARRLGIMYNSQLVPADTHHTNIAAGLARKAEAHYLSI